MKRMLACIGGILACALAAQAAEEPCGKLGTTLEWEESIAAAAAKAHKDGKLVLVLHVSGEFDDPALT